MKKYFFLFFIVIYFGLPATAVPLGSATLPAQNWQVTLPSEESSVEFVAIGRPTALKIRGKGGVPEGSFLIQKNEVTGSVEVILENFDTGIGLRNEHMRKKYLEIEKFPKAKLEVKKMILPDSFWTSGFLEDISYEGTLTLHGKSKPMSSKASLAKAIERTETTILIKTSFSLKLSDFGITPPSFKGITVAQDVQVSVSFLASLKKL